MKWDKASSSFERGRGALTMSSLVVVEVHMMSQIVVREHFEIRVLDDGKQVDEIYTKSDITACQMSSYPWSFLVNEDKLAVSKFVRNSCLAGFRPFLLLNNNLRG